jgi:O-antigen/teichoic acid export membrane protein
MRGSFSDVRGSLRVWRTVRGVLAYTGSQYVARTLMLAKGLLLARLLGPNQYGVVAALGTVLAYATYLDFGVFQGQNREIPRLRGTGDEVGAARVAAVASGVAITVAVLVAVLTAAIVALELAGLVGGVWWFTAGLGATISAQLWTGHMHSLTYARKLFSAQSVGMLALTVADVSVACTTGYLWGAKGVVLTAWIAPIIQGIVLRADRSVRTIPAFDAKAAWVLARVGLPIGVMWFANTNMVGIDRIVVLAGVGVGQLGLYSLAGVAGGLTLLSATAIAGYIGPRILERVDTQGVLTDAGVALADVGQFLCAAGGATVVAAILPAIAPLTRLVLPDYAQGIDAAMVLVVANAVLGATLPANSVLVGRGMQVRVALLYVLDAAFNLVLDITLLNMGLGILGVALGSLVSYALLLLVLRLWVFSRTKGWLFASGWAILGIGAAMGMIGRALVPDSSALSAIIAATAAASITLIAAWALGFSRVRLFIEGVGA